MLGLLLLAGLRLGEMMALTRGQLRFDDDLIVIDRSVRVEFGGKQSIGLPKGRKTRNAVMCRTLKDALVPFTLTMAEDALLFPATSANKPRMKKVFYRAWEEARKASGLPSDMSPHDCRLTHINIIEKMMPRVSITSLKEHVGHAASGVTEANYTRPITSAQRVLHGELDRVFGTRKSKSR
jgi:integrase